MERDAPPRKHIAAALGAAAEVLTYEELGQEALAATVRAVGASNALLYRYDEQGMVHGVAGSLAAAIPAYSRELFLEDPVQHHLLRLGSPRSVVLTVHEMDRRAYRKSLAYTDFYRPHGMEHLLGMWLTDVPYGAPGMAGILFTRALGEPDFEANQARVLARVVPALHAAARRIRRLERAQTERLAIGAVVSAVAPGAHAALDVRGRVLWISPEADAMLALGRERTLPQPLLEAVARLGAVARGEVVDAQPFSAQVPVPTGLVRADLRIACAQGGEPVVAVTFSRPSPNLEGARERVSTIADGAGLTRAEAAVLGCLGEGLSNREIAERLFVSIETVKTHVQRILAKLGVSSRMQAAAVVNRPR